MASAFFIKSCIGFRFTLLNQVSDAIMMAELEDILAWGALEENSALLLISAVTTERPTLAPVLQDMTLINGTTH